jgi:hypothetical protein
MSAQSDRTHTAQIVDMVSLLDVSSRKRVVTSFEQPETATLLSIRQNLSYQACIGIDNIDLLRTQLSQNLTSLVIKQVRGFLNAEFGRLRVHRYRQVFAVGHSSLDGLVGGLLRVQFYARQVELPVMEGLSEPRLLSLSWGVGETVLEAENERQRRQRLKS